jgi:hypothetical protein
MAIRRAPPRKKCAKHLLMVTAKSFGKATAKIPWFKHTHEYGWLSAASFMLMRFCFSGELPTLRPRVPVRLNAISRRRCPQLTTGFQHIGSQPPHCAIRFTRHGLMLAGANE